jgi:hypothetical protein
VASCIFLRESAAAKRIREERERPVASPSTALPLCLAQDKLCAITDQQRSEKMTFLGSRRSCAAGRILLPVYLWPVTRARQKYENGAKARMENNKYKQTRYKEYVKFIINSHSRCKILLNGTNKFFCNTNDLRQVLLLLFEENGLGKW